jgi:hypothetical protein
VVFVGCSFILVFSSFSILTKIVKAIETNRHKTTHTHTHNVIIHSIQKENPSQLVLVLINYKKENL